MTAMSITPGFTSITALTQCPLDTAITSFVAEICEIYPRRGTSQEISFVNPRGGVIMGLIYDQPSAIEQTFTGGMIRVTSSPRTPKALAWERAKSEKPSSGQGVVIIRSRANIEVMHGGKAAETRFGQVGFTVPAPVSQPDRPAAAPAKTSAPLPAPVMAAPVAAVAPVAPPPPAAPPSDPASNPPMTSTGNSPIALLAQTFASCLQSARMALGPGADPEDIRAAARVIYEDVRPRHLVGAQ